MGNLYAGESWLEILFITGLLGGGAAWLAGRAIAGMSPGAPQTPGQ